MRLKKKSSKNESYAYTVFTALLLLFSIRLCGLYGCGEAVNSFFLTFLLCMAFPFCCIIAARFFIKERRSNGNRRNAFSYYKTCILMILAYLTLSVPAVIFFKDKLSQYFFTGKSGEGLIVSGCLIMAFCAVAQSVYLILAERLRTVSADLFKLTVLIVLTILFGVLYTPFKSGRDKVVLLLDSENAGGIYIAGCIFTVAAVFALVLALYMIFIYRSVKKRIKAEIRKDIQEKREPVFVNIFHEAAGLFAVFMPLFVFVPVIFFDIRNKNNTESVVAGPACLLIIYHLSALILPFHLLYRELSVDGHLLYVAYRHEARAEAKSRIEEMMRCIMPSVFFMTAVFASLSPAILKLICAVDEKKSFIYASVFSLSVPFGLFALFFLSVLISVRQKGRAAVSVYAAVIPAVLIYVIMRGKGIDPMLAVSVSFSLCEIILCFFAGFIMLRLFDASFPMYEAIRYVITMIASGLAMAFIFLLLEIAGLHAAVAVIPAFIAGGFLYLILIFVLGVFKKEDIPGQPFAGIVLRAAQLAGFAKKKKKRRV